MLKTAWNNWDKYLSPYIKTKNTILNIKPNTGATTSWFLNNLCSNPQSLVFAVDTWITNENIFDNNLLHIKTKSQLIKIKNNISNTLANIIINNIYKFNIIYLNASYDALTVFNDIILIWDLLENNSILILDEYELTFDDNKLNPKLGIDKFIYQYLSQIDILSKDSQIIIKKNITKEIKLELLTPYTDVINKINAYTLTNMFYTIKYKITQKLNYKLILSNEPNDYLEELGYDINYKKELSRHDLKEIKMHEYNEINALLHPFERYRKINDLLYNDNESFNPYKNIIEIYKLLHYNSEMPVFENFNTIIDNNLLTLHKNISFLNCTFSPQPTNKTIKYILKKIYSNIKTINYYDLNISSNNIMSNYITKLYNITEIDYTITKFKTKMNLIVMALVSIKLFNIDAYLYEKYYTQQFFYSIIFVLQLLKKNGTCIILSFSYFTEISIELLYILKKFFKKLVFTKYTTGKHSTSSTKIIASRFKGISKEELNELLKIAKEISIYNKKYDNYDKNYKFIKSILDIDKTDKEYKLFRAEVIKFNTLNKKYTENNINLFSKIIQFYKTNNDNKLLDDILIRKQIHILFLWLNKYNILKICNN